MAQRLDYSTVASDGMKALSGVYSYPLRPAEGARRPRLPASIQQINGCAYCIDMHSRDLLKGGLAVEKLILVPAWREAGSLFSEQERAALGWAETVTQVAETAVPDAEFQSAWPVQREATCRPHHRDRPHERL